MTNTFELVSKGYEDAKAWLVGKRSEQNLLQTELQEVLASVLSATEELDEIQQTQIFLQNLSEAARMLAKDEIETIVTNALQYVFGEDYAFKINIRPTRSRPEADFLVCTRHGDKFIDSTPTLSNGGGITDLLAVALKFSLIELLGYDGPLWLDEPFKQLSEEYVPNAGKLLTFICETSGRQVNLITHNYKLVELCNKVFHVNNIRGKSSVTVS